MCSTSSIPTGQSQGIYFFHPSPFQGPGGFFQGAAGGADVVPKEYDFDTMQRLAGICTPPYAILKYKYSVNFLSKFHKKHACNS